MDKVEDKIELVEVTVDDIDLLFKWANDSECRRNSFNSEKIIYSEHKKWFNKKIEDNNCKMYLYRYNTEYIGQIRIEIQGVEAFIDYSIKREYRGKGHGIKILELLEKKILELDNIKIDCLVGEVKIDNIASQKVFEKLEYSGEKKQKYISYKKYCR